MIFRIQIWSSAHTSHQRFKYIEAHALVQLANDLDFTIVLTLFNAKVPPRLTS